MAPRVRKGHYSDGHPLDDLQYLECKIILNGDRFTSVANFKEFAALVKQAAKNADIGFSRRGFKKQRPQIREVLFLDTEDFKLYNSAFILRRRVTYVDGFAVGDPEVVFKFRHPDLQKAASIDVRPKIEGNYRIKFKSEALPLKDQIGGMRILYSHNAEFPLSAVHTDRQLDLESLVRMLPLLQTLNIAKDDKIELVNQTAVEEVLLDIGMLDFGKGVTAKANVAVWRSRGDQRQLVGEFAFQCQFKRGDALHAVVMKRCEQFFISLQHVAEQWLSVGTTKTGVVYRLKGNPPTAHE
ncbi:MAG: hypothetical protein JO205_01125 [Pseudolabrys sp.]|nr:hypothetical protein [Pseudolabrys sp.]